MGGPGGSKYTRQQHPQAAPTHRLGRHHPPLPRVPSLAPPRRTILGQGGVKGSVGGHQQRGCEARVLQQLLERRLRGLHRLPSRAGDWARAGLRSFSGTGGRGGPRGAGILHTLARIAQHPVAEPAGEEAPAGSGWRPAAAAPSRAPGSRSSGRRRSGRSPRGPAPRWRQTWGVGAAWRAGCEQGVAADR